MANYLIIGASSGIGRSLALELSNFGHQVFGTYAKNPIESSAILNYNYLNILDEKLDFSFLPETLDGFVFCPGSINLKPFERIKAEDFIQDFKLQVIGAIKCIQAVLPKLQQSKQASIVLFSTVAVQTGLLFHTQIAASKGAIEGLVRSLAAEFSPKIRVNGIAPSLTDTPLAATLLNTDQKREANAQRHPLKKIGMPSDIANMASFLLSPNSGFITGQIFAVDGGMSSIRL